MYVEKAVAITGHAEGVPTREVAHGETPTLQDQGFAPQARSECDDAFDIFPADVDHQPCQAGPVWPALRREPGQKEAASVAIRSRDVRDGVSERRVLEGGHLDALPPLSPRLLLPYAARVRRVGHPYCKDPLRGLQLLLLDGRASTHRPPKREDRVGIEAPDRHMRRIAVAGRQPSVTRSEERAGNEQRLLIKNEVLSDPVPNHRRRTCESHDSVQRLTIQTVSNKVRRGIRIGSGHISDLIVL